VKFPDELRPDASGLAFVGADFAVDTIVDAYTRGLFPWRGGADIPWYLPDPRAVLFAGDFARTRSLEKRARSGLTVAFDRDPRGAQQRCETTKRPGRLETWITPDMIAAYDELFARGIAHAVEVYRDGEPVGGLYGLTFGRMFHGESMYYRERDASKLALAALDEALAARGFELIDCQVMTSHLRSLGARAITRADYAARLAANRSAASLHTSWADWRVELLPGP
jgi:leucyl/phenylalanyl-tRNA--protein transferase